MQEVWQSLELNPNPLSFKASSLNTYLRSLIHNKRFMKQLEDQSS